MPAVVPRIIPHPPLTAPRASGGGNATATAHRVRTANAIGTTAAQRVPAGSANRPVIRRAQSSPSLSFVARLRGASKLRAHRVGRIPKKIARWRRKRCCNLTAQWPAVISDAQ